MGGKGYSKLTKRLYIWDKGIEKCNWPIDVKLILKDWHRAFIYM
jgi:hypothetical protein